MCQGLFIKRDCNFIKKDTLTQVFSCEFCEISKNAFSTEHLWTTASELTLEKGGYVIIYVKALTEMLFLTEI